MSSSRLAQPLCFCWSQPLRPILWPLLPDELLAEKDCPSWDLGNHYTGEHRSHKTKGCCSGGELVGLLPEEMLVAVLQVKQARWTHWEPTPDSAGSICGEEGPRDPSPHTALALLRPVSSPHKPLAAPTACQVHPGDPKGRPPPPPPPALCRNIIQG